MFKNLYLGGETITESKEESIANVVTWELGEVRTGQGHAETDEELTTFCFFF